MRNLCGFVVLLAVLLLLTACGEADLPATSEPAEEPIPTSNVPTPTRATPPQADDLENTWWRLTAMGDQEGPAVELATLGISDGIMQGTGGCNSYELTFTTTPDGALALSEPVMSATSCPQPHGVMAVEEEFFTRLAQVAGYDLADDHLTLLNAAGEPLLDFMVDARILLHLSSWVVVGINGEPPSEHLSAGFHFHEHRVQIPTSCHMVFMDYQSNEVTTMSLTGVDIADEFCDPDDPGYGVSEAFVNDLPAITTMRKVDQTHMELASSDGSLAILLEETSWTHPVGLLLGTRWVLDEFNGAPLPEDVLAVMLFGNNGTVGMAGCREGFPSAEFLDDGTVKPYDRSYIFDERCGPDGPGEVPLKIFEAAATIERYAHLPGRLELLDGDGLPVLVFRQVPTETELSETSWIPVTIGGEPVIGDTGISLSFRGVWMSISDGCNGGGGEYMVPAPGRIYASAGEMTAQDCDEIVPGERAQRDRYMSIFEASSYQLTATTLELFDDQGHSLAEFQARVQRYGLEDTSWLLTTMNGASVHEDANITLNIGRQGTGGWSGCNEYVSSDLQFDRESIQNLLRGTNEEGCKPGMPEEEYYETLMSVERYQLNGERLTLIDANGQSVLEYRLAWDVTALTGNDWLAVIVLGEPLEGEESVRFSFAGNQVNIWPGCMQVQFGGFGIDGSKIFKSGPFFSSAEHCDFTAEGYPEGVPLDAYESISSIAGYRFLDDNQLELVNNAGESLFVLEPVEGP